VTYSPREVIAAADYLGEDVVAEIVGSGGLSGATDAQLVRLVELARKRG
jgi:hypothetical protein